MQRDSKSTHRDSLNARSSILVSKTIGSEERFSCPKFTLMNKSPSVGRVARGCVTSHATWARTFVSPNETNTQPHSLPKLIVTFLNSVNDRPSNRCWNEIDVWMSVACQRIRQTAHLIPAQTSHHEVFFARWQYFTHFEWFPFQFTSRRFSRWNSWEVGHSLTISILFIFFQFVVSFSVKPFHVLFLGWGYVRFWHLSYAVNQKYKQWQWRCNGGGIQWVVGVGLTGLIIQIRIGSTSGLYEGPQDHGWGSNPDLEDKYGKSDSQKGMRPERAIF